MSITAKFRSSVDRWRDRTAMVYSGKNGVRRLSFGYFSGRSRRFAVTLEELGITSEYSVAIHLAPIPEWWEVAAGSIRAGVPFSTVPPGHSLTDWVNFTRAEVVVVAREALREAVALREGGFVRFVILVEEMPQPDTLRYQTMLFLADPDEFVDSAPDEKTQVVMLDETGTRDQAQLDLDASVLGLDQFDREETDLHWNLVPRHQAAGVLLGLLEPWSTGAAVFVDGCDNGAQHVLSRFRVATVSTQSPCFATRTAVADNSVRNVLVVDNQPSTITQKP
ncbi:AMP-binding protein [Saccharopolyspora gloriosae]|uniref:AMP-binding protein n=1 Tax=Saccharopolyspora gloriosae TaxID=455344 RepID=UPI001FB6FDD5|nr:AMP-binding protein [Saccharopolyspora gloriosae]